MTPISRVRLAALAGAASLALLAGSAAAQTPFQGTQGGDFQNAVQVKGSPTAYVVRKDDANTINRLIASAEYGIESCDQKYFNEAIAGLKAEAARFDLLYNAANTEAQKYAAADRGFLADRSAKDAADALQDANTVASAINWLLSKSWAHCKKPARSAQLLQLNGHFLGGGEQIKKNPKALAGEAPTQAVSNSPSPAPPPKPTSLSPAKPSYLTPVSAPAPVSPGKVALAAAPGAVAIAQNKAAPKPAAKPAASAGQEVSYHEDALPPGDCPSKGEQVLRSGRVTVRFEYDPDTKGSLDAAGQAAMKTATDSARTEGASQAAKPGLCSGDCVCEGMTVEILPSSGYGGTSPGYGSASAGWKVKGTCVKKKVVAAPVAAARGVTPPTPTPTRPTPAAAALVAPPKPALTAPSVAAPKPSYVAGPATLAKPTAVAAPILAAPAKASPVLAKPAAPSVVCPAGTKAVTAAGKTTCAAAAAVR